MPSSPRALTEEKKNEAKLNELTKTTAATAANQKKYYYYYLKKE